VKPKLLIVELWGLGDLVIATPFIRAVAEKFDITLLAKPFALDLRPRLWPAVKVVTFTAPWTAFKNKYHLWRWPLLEMIRLRRKLAAEHFDYGLSARWDPRDHPLLKFVGVKNRLGFPRWQSQIFLTQLLLRPEPKAHRYENWRVAGKAMGIELPPRDRIAAPVSNTRRLVLVHSGARLPARVWPLERYGNLVRRLRASGFAVQVACDPNQLSWWQRTDGTAVACPRTVTELFSLIDQAGVFIGNCSGPGHLAAISGVPTFTIFGPSVPEWFAPLHPAAEWIEDKTCPYKPCSDYCHFATPHCLWNITEEEVWARVEKFATAHVRNRP
jgi:heptosyltransferase-2